jgi:hypothetical protein
MQSYTSSCMISSMMSSRVMMPIGRAPPSRSKPCLSASRVSCVRATATATASVAGSQIVYICSQVISAGACYANCLYLTYVICCTLLTQAVLQPWPSAQETLQYECKSLTQHSNSSTAAARNAVCRSKHTQVRTFGEWLTIAR